MTEHGIETWVAGSIAQLASTVDDWGKQPVVDAWHLCLAIVIASALAAAIAVRSIKTVADWYIKHKKKQVVKEEWGNWRTHGLPREALHAVAYYCFAMIVLKVGFEFARASGLKLPVIFEVLANVVAFVVLLLYALRQLKERHKGDERDLALRFASYSLFALIALHHSDIVRRFAAPVTVYAIDALPL